LVITLKTEASSGNCDIAASTEFEFEFAVAANIATNAATANTPVAYELETSVDTDKTTSATGYTIKKSVTSASFVADDVRASVKPTKFTIGGTTSAVGALAKDGTVTVTAVPDVFVTGGADLAITITKPTLTGCTATGATTSAKILVITLKTEASSGNCDIAASTEFEFEFAVAANIATNAATVGSVAYQLESSVDTDKTMSATGYKIKPQDATFSATPADSSGTITATTSVSLAATGSAHICYTVDGSTTPACDGAACASSSGTKYTTALSVTATTTIKAIGCGGAGNDNSDVSEKAYTWTAANPTIDPAAGNVAKDSAVTLTSAGSANICYTWTGTAPACKTDGTCETNSTAYNAAAKPTVSATKTLKAIGCAGTGKTDSAVVTAAYTVNVTTTTAAPAAATTTVSGASSEAAWSTMLTVFAIAMAAFSTL